MISGVSVCCRQLLRLRLRLRFDDPLLRDDPCLVELVLRLQGALLGDLLALDGLREFIAEVEVGDVHQSTTTR